MALLVLLLVLLEDAPVVEDAGTVLTGVAMAGHVWGGRTGTLIHIAAGLFCPSLDYYISYDLRLVPFCF